MTMLPPELFELSSTVFYYQRMSCSLSEILPLHHHNGRTPTTPNSSTTHSLYCNGTTASSSNRSSICGLSESTTSLSRNTHQQCSTKLIDKLVLIVAAFVLVGIAIQSVGNMIVSLVNCVLWLCTEWGGLDQLLMMTGGENQDLDHLSVYGHVWPESLFCLFTTLEPPNR